MKVALVFVSLLLHGNHALADSFPYQVAGMRWSENLGKATNGCAKLNGFGRTVWDAQGFAFEDESRCTSDPRDRGKVRPEDSEAAILCINLGGHLPSKGEYERLVRSFGVGVEYFEDENYGPLLNAAGLRAAARAFGMETLTNQVFWSSSIDGISGCRFFGDNDQMADPVGGVTCDIHFGHRGGAYDYRANKSVRCIAGP